ncbi:TonB-dependent receptor [Aestuariibacter halophilus]|uniref:TonB-dependent receptor n=1 Tax=Fluctibacter halophilus TaxID=226011 RepID=A0ABS8G5W8_9ALTE|nr:TonB-dependent receptor [Aestuariibacter halophilus]MCC2615506.1 TonB-dependent receptor [Aestuariibacter halophilus]
MLLAVGTLTACYAQAEDKTNFSIPSQPANQALTEFARQANITLLFPVDLAEQVSANALFGNYSVELGIVKLLEGTTLYAVADEQGRLTVKPVPTFPVAAESPPLPTSQTGEEAELAESIEKIAIVGTRASPRSEVASVVPLDIISQADLEGQGDGDLINLLTNIVPSLNVNDQPINDATTLVRPVNLRGMAADHTLVLVNGKRRHRSAVITFLGGGLSDGAQGPDISTIPASALQQVEVLRDGAAAQYGSDAIAGVINFVLKDDSSGGELSLKGAEYGAGDGEMVQLQWHQGFSLLDTGFVALSAEYRQQHGTSRSVQRDDAQQLIDSGNRFVPQPAQHWGSPAVDHDVKFAVNAGVPIGQDSEWYLFGILANRDVAGGFYYRHPHLRRGVFTDGEGNLLVGDLDGLGQGVSCPSVPINDDNVLDDTAYQLIADPSSAVGQNCFAFNELFPGGFTPTFSGDIDDGSLYTGVRSRYGEWSVDGGLGIGYSAVDYRLFDTVNPSLGPDSPTEFLPGSVSQREFNVNLDVQRSFDLHTADALHLAAGFEWRRESYEQTAGDPASHTVGLLAYDPATGMSQGFGIGSNGFPGYKQASAGRWTRGNWALYTDVEAELSSDVVLGLAARFEHFTDFGSTFDGKVSARFRLDEALALRGSISSGFKAPTVGQSNVINVTTAFGPNGLEDQATLPPTNPISQQLGATALSPEESVNLSFGLVGDFLPQWSFTLDYFNIQLTDRISTTSAIPLTDEDIDALLRQGIQDALSFSAAKYFTNDFDTTTQGIDLVVNGDFTWHTIPTRLTLAYNWTDTEVDRLTTYRRQDADGNIYLETNLTEQRIRMIEDNLPAHRLTVSLRQSFEHIATQLRLNYYGGFYEDHLDASAGFDIYSGGIWTLDGQVSWQLNEALNLTLGAKNLLDKRPDENPYQGEVGSRYPATSPSGINGALWYLRGKVVF